MPGASPVRHAAHARGGLARRPLERGELVAARSPPAARSAGSMRRSVAFSTSPLGSRRVASSSTRNAGSLHHLARRVRLPAHDPDPAVARDALVAEDLGQRCGGVAGLARAGSSPGRMTSRIGRGAAAAMPAHSLPTRTAGSPDGPDDQHRLLEARVEAAEVGEVGAVLAVGPDDEVAVSACVHRRAEARPAARRRSSSASSGSVSGIPKSGKAISAKSGGGLRRRHAVTP